MTVAQDSIEVENLGGYAIHASDGEIGRVDKHDIATGVSYLVVATGPWILSRTVLLPASVIERVDHENQAVYVKCTRAEIKDAPEYRDEESHRADLLNYYRSMPRGPAGTL
jgi:hypothetical protein